MQPKELKERMKGVLHLVMTPFDGNEELDEKALRECLRYTVDKLQGEDAVFIATGSTGEFYAMTDEECKKVAEITVAEVNGQFPVIVGTGRAGTKPAIEMSRHAQDVGTDGVMIVLPYYHLPTKEGLYRHYKRIAESIDVGIIVYNNPEVSKVWIEPDLMARLSKIDNIVALKENTPNAINYYWMQKAVDPEDMVIVCGPGEMMFAFEALYGAPGYVTDLSNFAPELAVELYKAAKEKAFKKLIKITDKISLYAQFVGKVGERHGPVPAVMSSHLTGPDLPIYQSVCKEAMNLIGLPGGKARDPMENLTPEEKEELRSILKELGVLRDKNE